MHLTFVYVTAILNFVNAIRSETDQPSHFSFKPMGVFGASNGLEIVRKTRLAKHEHNNIPGYNRASYKTCRYQA